MGKKRLGGPKQSSSGEWMCLDSVVPYPGWVNKERLRISTSKHTFMVWQPQECCYVGPTKHIIRGIQRRWMPDQQPMKDAKHQCCVYRLLKGATTSVS